MKKKIKKSNKLKIGKKYIVIWQDTFSESGWFNTDEIINKAKKQEDVESIGYYFGKENNFLIFTRDYLQEDDNCGDPVFIPYNCIKEIKLI